MSEQVWEKDSGALRRAYEGRLVPGWTEARDKVAAMEADDEISSRRKRAEDQALMAKYGMFEGRGQ